MTFLYKLILTNKYLRYTPFFWWWFGECFDEWCYTMMNEDGELFNYLQSDYVKYEEDMYYETH